MHDKRRILLRLLFCLLVYMVGGNNMYIFNTSDGTRVEIESGVYAITHGETNIVTDAHGFNGWLLWWGLQAAENDA